MLHTTFNRLKLAGACGQRQGSDKGYDKLATHLGGTASYGKDMPIPLDVVVESNGLLDALWCLHATTEDFDTVVHPFIRGYLADILEHIASRISSAKTKSLLDAAVHASTTAASAAATYVAAAYTADCIAERKWQTERFLTALRGG